MTLEELKDRLREINNMGDGDPEASHGDKDNLLLEYIGDDEVWDLFNTGTLWYA